MGGCSTSFCSHQRLVSSVERARRHAEQIALLLLDVRSALDVLSSGGWQGKVQLLRTYRRCSSGASEEAAPKAVGAKVRGLNYCLKTKTSSRSELKIRSTDEEQPAMLQLQKCYSFLVSTRSCPLLLLHDFMAFTS